MRLPAPRRGNSASSHPPVSLHDREGIDNGLETAGEQPADEVGTLDGPHSREAKEDDAAVGPGLEDDKLAEVLVVREQHPTTGERSAEHVHIRDGRCQRCNPLHVVSVSPEPRYHGTEDVLVRPGSRGVLNRAQALHAHGLSREGQRRLDVLAGEPWV